MLSTGTVAVILVFSIPILGILVGGLKSFLDFKSRQMELGTSTDALESQVDALEDRLRRVESQRDALVRRVENLETIVTSDAWDALDASDVDAPPALNAPETNARKRLDDGLLDESDDAASDAAAQSADLARRLRSREQ